MIQSGVKLALIINFFMTLSAFAAGNGDDKFPLVRLYLESDSSYSIDYHQKALNSCKVDFKQSTAQQQESHHQALRTNEIKKWCQQDKVFYRLDQIKYSGCNWENQIPESPVKSIGPLVDRMKKGFAIKNLEVAFQNKVLFCRGDLLIPGVSKSIKVEGLCAPVDSSKIDTQKLPEFSKNPVVGFLKPVDFVNPLQDSIHNMLKIGKEKLSLKISVAIPVPWKISQDIAYLLSEKGMKMCQSMDVKNSRKVSSLSLPSIISNEF